MIECVNTRFFKLEHNTQSFIDEMIGDGYWCQLIKTCRGFIVNVFAEVD